MAQGFLMTMTDVSSTGEAEALLRSPTPVLLFKHSTRCPVSAAARRRAHAFMESNSQLSVCLAEVLVIEHRPVSLWLAQRLGVNHASPQLILINDGKALWDVSHSRIQERTIAEALGRHSFWEQPR